MTDYQTEWKILHGDIEKYERFSLVIKLTAVLSAVLCKAFTIELWFAIPIVLVLWLQDGIWKTFQGRLGRRIEYLEQQIQKTIQEGAPFQLYTQWESQRPGIVGLITEYIKSSLKPTVAFPYVVLIILLFF